MPSKRLGIKLLERSGCTKAGARHFGFLGTNTCMKNASRSWLHTAPWLLQKDQETLEPCRTLSLLCG
jgi:hypothetical protein